MTFRMKLDLIRQTGDSPEVPVNDEEDTERWANLVKWKKDGISGHM